MQKKYHIKKGDVVMVITGNDKGKQGRVLEIITKKDKAIVEGINLISKHTKPNAASPQGGIIKKEAPIHISNLKLIDPSNNKATRTSKGLNSKGERVRISKKSGEEIK